MAEGGRYVNHHSRAHPGNHAQQFRINSHKTRKNGAFWARISGETTILFLLVFFVIFHFCSSCIFVCHPTFSIRSMDEKIVPFKFYRHPHLSNFLFSLAEFDDVTLGSEQFVACVEKVSRIKHIFSISHFLINQEESNFL